MTPSDSAGKNSKSPGGPGTRVIRMKTSPVRTVIVSGSRTGCRYAELLESMDEVELLLGVTWPDRPRGRGRKVLRGYLASYCDRSGLTAFQTEDINSPESVEAIKKTSPHAGFVVDFGQILSEEVLGLFPMGCYNIHYSLLPDLRGAAPVRWALFKGYSRTGVTLIRMNEGVDAGDIISSLEEPVLDTDNYASLKERLTLRGVELTGDFFRRAASGENIPVSPQGERGVSRAPKIKGRMRIDWSDPAVRITGLIRGMSPSPGCWSTFTAKELNIKIISAAVSAGPFGLPGRVFRVCRDYFDVSASDGCVRILSLQPSGKRIMSAAEFMAGNPVREGDIFE